MNDKRLDDIEIKLTSQEDLLDTLNMQVYQQQKKIDGLELLCAELVKRIKELTLNHSQTGLPHDRPPHY